MRKFERDQMVEEDSGEPGIHIARIGRALMVWVTMNYGRERTVSAAAQAFNTTEEIVIEAVNSQYWLFLSGDEIEVEGE
jgi:hypothetical protein